MIGAPFLVLGLLLTLTAVVGGRVEGRGRGAVATIVSSPLHPATWAATAAILVGFWVELFAFIAIMVLLSGGASLLVVGVGFVLVGVGIELARAVARTERRRARWADPTPLHAHEYRPYGTGVRDLVLAVFLDLSRWRDVIYVLIAFPLAILDGFEARDVAFSVRFRPVSGSVDQAAGLVVRLRDPRNYYIVRANALEDNVRLYRVVDGRRTQFAGVDVRVPRDRWQALGLRVAGGRFEVSLDGRTLFSATDRTFAESGRVGLWTKADSVTHFDAFEVAALR